jgi:hypothetical protein
MTERVSTGGLKSFDYKSSSAIKLSEQEKKEIHEAYAKANERKRKEKTRRNLIILIIVILAILTLGFLAFKYII